MNLLTLAQTTQGTTEFPLPPWALAVCGFIVALGIVATALGGFYWKFSGPFWEIVIDIRAHLAAVEKQVDRNTVGVSEAKVIASEAKGEAKGANVTATAAALQTMPLAQVLSASPPDNTRDGVNQ